MSSFVDTFGALSSTLHGLVISSVLLSAAVASLFAGSLSDSLGRTRAIAIGALVFAVGAAMEAGSMNLIMLVFGRAIMGVGEGLFFSTLVVYICEVSPPQKRGFLAYLVQVHVTLGLCLGYFVSYGTVRISSSLSWRLPLALQSVIAILMAVASSFYLPQSPRWLNYKGRRDEALAVWEQLGVLAAEREKDDELEQIEPTTASRELAGRNRPWKQQVASAFKIFGKDGRKQMALGVFMMGMQQLSGIDGVLYYAPLLFQQAGLSSAKASFLASGVSAIVIFAVTIPAFLFADRWSRRSSTSYGGLGVFACMTIIGSLYASNSVHANEGAGRWAVIVAIYIFLVFYCMTWAGGMKIYASEIQPVATRAGATSLAQSANCITNFLVAFTTPIFLASSSFGVYFLFGGASILTVIVCTIFMPETRGRSLEAIDESFRQPKIIHFTMPSTFHKVISRVSSRYGRAEIRGNSTTSEVEMSNLAVSS
ncbi:MAG: hypothetical protein M1812_003953 [Candelaria pacifica]|nr:MAG: hypothetical protein M1812_003953 [Candelaria pacifica]